MVTNPSSVAVPGAGGPSAPNPSTLTIFDIVGLAFGALGLFWAGVVVLAIQPVFAKMFAEWRIPLPGFTELCLKPWFPFAIQLIPILLVSTGVIRGAKPR